MPARRSRRASAGDAADADPEAVAQAICLRLLAGAPRTRAQLADALTARGVPEGVTAAVLDRFGDVGLVDDAAFASAWVTSRHVGRGLARRALGDELRRCGVERSVAAAALTQVDDAAELERARALVRRRLATGSTAPPDVRARRLAGMLARKGYPAGLAWRVVIGAVGDQALDEPPGADEVIGS